MTGVLPVTLNDATKAVQVLLHGGKEYVCVMKLHGDAHEMRIKEVLGEFEDTIFQRPPLRSSVKRRVRIRRIYYLVFLEKSGRNVLFRVGCEGGTYIRKLCFDVGEVLGCGAHMQELRRSRSGPFDETGSVILHDLAYSFMEWQEKENDEMLKRFIQPVEQGLVLTPKIYIRDTAVDAVCHGASLAAPGVLSLESGITKESAVALLSLKGEAVALGRALASTEQIFDMEHGFVASTERVLMQRGTYPKRWKTGEKENDQKK